MGSKFVVLTDEELRDKLRQAGGEAMIGTWQSRKTGRYEAGLRVPARGMVLPLSSHDDEDAAVQAARDLEVRLDRLAAEGGGVAVRNLFDDLEKGSRH